MTRGSKEALFCSCSANAAFSSFGAARPVISLARMERKVAVSIINARISALSALPRSRDTTTSGVVVVVVDRAVSRRGATRFITVARGRFANSSFAAPKLFGHQMPQQGQELKC